MTGADPGSCSGLGGALRTVAARLAEAGAERGGAPARLAGDIGPVLDAAGSRLQGHAQELAELAAGAARLEARVAAAGLELSGLRVREPTAVLGGPAAEHRGRSDLQALADRLAARHGRCRAELVRRLREGTEQLGRVTATLSGAGGRRGID